MADPSELPRRRYPCSECPWRCDTPPGKFPAERYEALRATSGTRGREAPVGSPMFACHKSPEGREEACAGWLAAVGYESLTVRLQLAFGRLDPAALTPGDDWPELFDSYEQMAATQGSEEPR